MIKFIFLINIFISVIISQVIPEHLTNIVKIDQIPETVPTVYGNQKNINFLTHSKTLSKSDGSYSYLNINSFHNGNYQMKITDILIEEDSYLAFYDQNQNVVYGPYMSLNQEVFYPSVMNGNDITIIFYQSNDSKSSFTIESINSVENKKYLTNNFKYKISNQRNRPILMVTGYWPPTNEMLRHFSQKPELNPSGWEGENWNNLGFDVVSFFPEFNPPDCSNCGQGYGDFEVDYQDTSQDFWRIIDEVKPVGIITFSRGFNNNSWELENNVYNWVSWNADYTAPLYPTPTPPDDSVSDNHNRGTALPLTLIEEALDNSNLPVNCYVDQNGDAGRFLSEFMGYHGMWYHQSSLNSDNPCMLGGHIHVGGQLSTRVAKDAAELTIETVITYLDSILFIPGDINDDEILNIIDVILLIDFILENTNPNDEWLVIADMNDDSIVNVLDVILIVDNILG